MGLFCAAVELIIQEHLYRPLQGEVALIGRQNTDITSQAMINLLALYGLSPRVRLAVERAGSLAHETYTLTSGIKKITDVSVFHALSDCTVKAIDISDYEGAEIIHDMNVPLPDYLKGRFDFVYDGSVLDNVFNGPQALINMSDLLRPGGRMVLFNASNSMPTAYLQFSPDWFIDYFAINHYADCKIYIHEFPTDGEPVISNPMSVGGLPVQGGCLWHFDPFVVDGRGSKGSQCSEIWDGVMRFVHVVAEKAADSTSTIMPVQVHYRQNDMVKEPYLKSLQQFRASQRPLFQPRTGECFKAPSISDWDVVHPIRRWTRRPIQHDQALARQHRLELEKEARIRHRLELEKEARIRERDRALAKRDEALAHQHRLELEKELRIRERDRALAERDEALAHQHRLELEKELRIRERDRALAERDEALAHQHRLELEKESRIRERDRALAERDEALAHQHRLELEKESRIRERDHALDERDVALARLRQHEQL